MSTHSSDLCGKRVSDLVWVLNAILDLPFCVTKNRLLLGVCANLAVICCILLDFVSALLITSPIVSSGGWFDPFVRCYHK